MRPRRAPTARHGHLASPLVERAPRRRRRPLDAVSTVDGGEDILGVRTRGAERGHAATYAGALVGVGETDRGESTAKTTGDAAGEVVETPPLKKAAKTEGGVRRVVHGARGRVPGAFGHVGALGTRAVV